MEMLGEFFAGSDRPEMIGAMRFQDAGGPLEPLRAPIKGRSQ
jgi:hypothetical protein